MKYGKYVSYVFGCCHSKFAYNVQPVYTVSAAGTPMSKSKKKFVPPRDRAAKPLLVCRWPPWRPGALCSQLQSMGVLSSLEEQSDRFSFRSTGLSVPGVSCFCKPSCPGFPELKGLVGEGGAELFLKIR
jgi:hypothetical protein